MSGIATTVFLVFVGLPAARVSSIEVPFFTLIRRYHLVLHGSQSGRIDTVVFRTHGMGWRWMTDGSAQYQEGRICTRFNVGRLEASRHLDFFPFNMYNIIPKALIQGLYLVRCTCTESTKVLLVMANVPTSPSFANFPCPTPCNTNVTPHVVCLPAPNPHHTTHPSVLPSPPKPPPYTQPQVL